MSITPEMLAKGASEHAEQSALFCWAALPDIQAKYPVLKLMFAIPNGGSRGDDRLRARKIGGEMKAEGAKAGVLDIFLPVSRAGWHGLFIEMKYGKNKPSVEQLEFATEVSRQLYKTALCYSWQAARDILIEYLNSRP